jgi:hypothetical protein
MSKSSSNLDGCGAGRGSKGKGWFGVFDAATAGSIEAPAAPAPSLTNRLSKAYRSLRKHTA